MPETTLTEDELMLRKPPEKAPELKKGFAVGGLLLRRLYGPKLPSFDGWMQVTALGIKTDVLTFIFPDEASAEEGWKGLKADFQKRGLEVSAVNGEGDGFAGAVMALSEPSVEERFFGEDDSNLRCSQRATINTDIEALKRFSRLTGLRVRYCLGQHITQPPLPNEGDALNIMMMLRPPGNFRPSSQRLKEVFGQKLWADGETRWAAGPTAWRGRLVAAEGIPLFQVLGENAYQMALFLSDNGNLFARGAVWTEMLALLARDLLSNAETAEAPEAQIEDLQSRVREMITKRTGEVRGGLETIDFELSELQRKLTEKLRERDIQVTHLKALEREAADRTERSVEDFARLRAMKDDIVAIHANAEDGLMVETVPIELDREGRRYGLGPFRIQISPEGLVAVWSETPKHPDGHHHPHIDKTHLECFGNATLAIAKLATAYRFADAIEMILRWLRSYRPETTLIPLEEFPSEPIATRGATSEKRVHAELLASAQSARPASPATGDPDRGRRGRKSRRVRARQDGGA